VTIIGDFDGATHSNFLRIIHHVVVVVAVVLSLSCVYNDKCQQKKKRKSFDFDTEMDVGKLLKKKKKKQFSPLKN
jgi:Na+/H+ antiporter NhaB